MDPSVLNEERKDAPETRCGILGIYPEWLQKFASKMSYVILFGLIGLNQFAINSYFVAIITTLEKRFKIPSQTSGIITGGLEIGTIFSSITMAYIGSKGHKTRWVALGTFCTSMACYSQLLPYYLYGPGSDAIAIANSGNTTESSSSSSSCGLGALHSEDCDDGSTSASTTPPILLFMSQVLMGIGTSMYWTLGISYLDDNVKKNQAPWLMAISGTIRLFGSPLGFWTAARSLEYYADPSLTPPITNKDPRWIGAWWLGFIPFGITATFFAFVLSLFPRILPTAPKLKQITESKKRNFKDFQAMLKRLFKNPLLMCNTFSYVFYMFGVSGFWVFMPKYMETQFYMTASEANQYTGSMGLFSAAFGVMLSGYVMTRLKPSARTISAWNLTVEILGVVCVILYAYLGCSEIKFQVGRTNDGTDTLNLLEECNSECNCGPSVPFEPVCDSVRSITFFSPCHAGCTDMTEINGTKTFVNCSCIPNFTAEESFCPVECQTNLTIFLTIYCLISFLSSTSHAGLAIIQFRTVDPEDKSVSIALSEMMCSMLSYIPSPMLFGYILDKTCLVWSETCGEPGNCWLYDGKSQREYLNFTAAVFLLIAAIFDAGVWYYSKNLILYDNDENEDSGNKSQDRRGSLIHFKELRLDTVATSS